MQNKYNKLATNYYGQLKKDDNGLLALVEQNNTQDETLTQKEEVIQYL